MGHGRVAERPDDREQGVGRPKLAQELVGEGGSFSSPAAMP